MVSGQQFWEWLQQAKQEAIASGVSPSELDWLVQGVTGLDKLAIRLKTPPVDPSLDLTSSLLHLQTLWQKRLQERIPLQYLLEIVPWRDFTLKVAPGVLIPRPETEEIIDLALQAAQGNAKLLSGHWVDIGTGSGAIAIGLARSFPQSKIHAIDCSVEALKIAQDNATRLGLKEQIYFYLGEGWQPLQGMEGKISGMVSNPPYIPSAELATLQPEVRLHEPALALDGGEDGLGVIRHLVAIAPRYVHSGGVWLIEMMAGQAESVQDLLQQQGSYREIQVFKDINGIERFVFAVVC